MAEDSNQQGQGAEAQGAPIPQIRPAPAPQRQNTAPAANSAKEIADTLAAMRGTAADLGKTMVALEGVLTNISKEITNSSSGFKDFRLSVLDIVDGLDDAEGTLRKLASLQRQVVTNPGLFNSRSREEVVASLKDITDALKEIDKSSIGAKQAKAVNEQYDKMVKLLHDVSKGTKEALDPSEAEEMEQAVQGLNLALRETARNVRDVQVDKLTSGFKQFFKILDRGGVDNVFTKKLGGLFDAYSNMRKRQAAWKDAGDALKDSRNRRTQAYRNEFAERLNSINTSSTDRFRLAAQGKIRVGRADAQNIAELMSSKKGVSGFVDRKIVQYIAQKGATSVLGRVALGAVQAGGGSFTSGLASGGMGLLEGAGGRIASLAGKAAVPLAIAQSIIKLRDMVVEQNKEIKSQLAGGGVFANTTNVMDTFSNVRKSLNSVSFGDASLYGMGYKENMKAAGSLIDYGISVQDLARKGVVDLGEGLNDRGTAQGEGFWGSWMKNRLVGRSAGLTDEQSGKLTLALMQKFNITSEATQEFFNNVNKRAASAGISVQKYIGIVEDVNGQFNEMNSALRTTVTLLTKVGSTGRLTGDQLREAARNLTSSPNMNEGQTAVAAQRIFADPELKQGLIKSLQGGLAGQADMVATKLKRFANLGAPTAARDATGGISNIQEIDAWIAREQNNPNSTVSKIDLNDIAVNLRKYQGASRRINPIINATENNNAGQFTGAVMAAGSNPVVNAALTSTFMKQWAKMSKADLGTLINGGVSGDELVKSLGSTVFANKSIGEVQDLLQSYKDLATGITDRIQTQVQSANPNELTGDQVRTFAEIQRRVLGKDTNASDEALAKQFAEQFANNPVALRAEIEKNIVKLVDVGMETNTSLNRLFEDTKNQTEINKAKSLESQTRTSAEIFASAFEKFFQWLVDKLDFVARVINPDRWKEFLFGGGDDKTKLKSGFENFKQAVGLAQKRYGNDPDKARRLQMLLDDYKTQDTFESASELNAALERLNKVAPGAASATRRLNDYEQALTGGGKQNFDRAAYDKGLWGRQKGAEAITQAGEMISLASSPEDVQKVMLDQLKKMWIQPGSNRQIVAADNSQVAGTINGMLDTLKSWGWDTNKLVKVNKANGSTTYNFFDQSVTSAPNAKNKANSSGETAAVPANE